MGARRLSVLSFAVLLTSISTVALSPAATAANDHHSLASSHPYKMTSRAELDKERAERHANPRTEIPIGRRAQSAGGLSQRPTNPMRVAAPTTSQLTTGTSFQAFSSSNSIPPDPSIAAGPTNLVVSSTPNIGVFSKAGTALSSQSWSQFFSSLGQPALDKPFDTTVTYDPYINRFWVLSASENDNPARSSYLIALSKGSGAALGTDNTQSWLFFSMDATVDQNRSDPYWCDYPRFGFDAQAIYITCNMWQFPKTSKVFEWSKIRVMTKSQFINNTNPLLWWDKWSIQEVLGTQEAYTIVPARMYGAVASNGEFLVDAQGEGGNASDLTVIQLTNVQNCCIAGQTPMVTLTQTSQHVLAYSAAPNAVQPGSTGIDTGDTRLLDLVWQQNRLSMGQNVACSGLPGDACAAFKEIDVSTFPTMQPAVNDWSLGPDSYYPQVDAGFCTSSSCFYAGRRVISFSESTSTQFVSSAIVSVPPATLCTGCFDSQTITSAGQASYVNLDANNRNRWGDFSGSSPDPDGTGIWVLGEFAVNGNTWGTEAVLTQEGQPQETWVQESQAPNLLAPRAGAAMAYIPTTGKVLLFGGWDPNRGLLWNDTWSWDGATWTQLYPTKSPSPRWLAAMAYDPATSNVVLFGGHGTSILGDTWVWDGSNWAQLQPKASPQARQAASVTFFSPSNQLLLFGGNNINQAFGDTWTWNGSTWSLARTKTAPSPRFGAAMTTLPSNVALLFGGYDYGQEHNDTWTWNGTSWALQCSSCSPSKRDGAGLAYDTQLGEAILFGGSDETINPISAYNDTWAWNGPNWVPINPSSLPAPPARFYFPMIYDGTTSTLLLFGGYPPGSTPTYADTWTY